MYLNSMFYNFNTSKFNVRSIYLSTRNVFNLQTFILKCNLFTCGDSTPFWRYRLLLEFTPRFGVLRSAAISS